MEEATKQARVERGRLEEEGQRKERVYGQNVRLLQEAATHLQEKLAKKQEVGAHLLLYLFSPTVAKVLTPISALFLIILD